MKAKQSIYTLVVGLGKTGLSVVRYLREIGEAVVVVDSRDVPPALSDLKNEYPEVKCIVGKFKKKHFVKAHRIIVSPGVALTEPALLAARNKNIEITGDIDLFAHEVNAPVVGITGTNGKSTVTTLVTLMASQAGMNAVAGGNIGLPALDVLDEDIDLYVLELSSFQLESLQCLPMKVAVVLNLSNDHLDRYENISAYAMAKQAIYKNAEVWVLNKDDPLADPVKIHNKKTSAENQIRFTLNTPEENEFGLCQSEMESDMDSKAGSSGEGEENPRKVKLSTDRTAIHGSLRHNATMAVLPGHNRTAIHGSLRHNATMAALPGHNYLCYGSQPLIAVNQLKMQGAHNLQNALAALALGKTVGLSFDSMINTLKEFKGLPHRTQFVAEINGVNWINDSKATNVGAAIAALVGLPGKHVLIAGGDAKGADFAELAAIVKQHCRAVVLMGVDAEKIKAVLPETVPVKTVSDMHSAIHAAHSLAKTGDNVLLAPACASFDMFDNFEHRGDVFIACVEALALEVSS